VRLKDEFLATLSHELRTPLNAVLGWSRLLASEKLNDAEAMRAIEAIERAGWAQARLIDDLLDLSRLVDGTLTMKPRPTFVQPLVENAVRALRPTADAKEIRIALHADPEPGPIVADPDRLQQVAWNLISNAIKFTRAGGRIWVDVTFHDRQLMLSVQDTGVGFGPEIASALFERFRQADSSSTRPEGGLGIGLALVRHLVELHGGTVSAHSEGIDRGSVFTVVVPARAAEVSTGDTTTAEQAATRVTPIELARHR
jgi:signal transduction histidine kinase